MRKLILELGSVVTLCRESNETFLIEVNFQGTHLRNESIDSHVPFHTLDKHRVVNILLEHRLLIIFEIFHFIQDEYAPSSTEIRRLAYPNTVLIAICVIIAYKLFVFVWHNKGQWGEIVNLSIQLFSFLYQTGQVVFCAD